MLLSYRDQNLPVQDLKTPIEHLITGTSCSINVKCVGVIASEKGLLDVDRDLAVKVDSIDEAIILRFLFSQETTTTLWKSLQGHLFAQAADIAPTFNGQVMLKILEVGGRIFASEAEPEVLPDLELMVAQEQDEKDTSAPEEFMFWKDFLEAEQESLGNLLQPLVWTCLHGPAAGTDKPVDKIETLHKVNLGRLMERDWLVKFVTIERPLGLMFPLLPTYLAQKAVSAAAVEWASFRTNIGSKLFLFYFSNISNHEDCL